jgi:hypothetical protein
MRVWEQREPEDYTFQGVDLVWKEQMTCPLSAQIQLGTWEKLILCPSSVGNVSYHEFQGIPQVYQAMARNPHEDQWELIDKTAV